MADDPKEVIDLFCGAGGLTAGLERAGWKTIAAVDSNSDSIATLRATQAAKVKIGSKRRHYLAGTQIIESDIALMRASELRPAGKPRTWRPTLLAGGPPCQPFSSAGKQRGLDDARGTLFLEFVRLTKDLRPRYILFENVRGLLTAKCQCGEAGGVLRSVQQSFEELGYACRFATLNAADFGAAQRRVRLFMLGSIDRELPEFPPPTHCNDSIKAKQLALLSWYTLGEFLKTQPTPKPVDVVRPSGARRAALENLMPGTGLRTQGIVEANRPSGHWGYRQDSFLADLNLPSRTIRAATTPDWIRVRSGELRRLTWRECAGLQGFSPEWQFVGKVASLFRQIGNAVEGHIAEAIGRSLITHTAEAKRDTPKSPEWPEYLHARVVYTAKEHITNGRHRELARARQD